MSKPSPDHSGLISFIKREPLIHFLGLAVLIFIANALFAGDEREVITVPWETQAYLFEQEENLLLRPLSDAEKQEIVRNFVDDEVLVREARRRGFDDSSRIRTLLVQNMRFFVKQDLPAPDEAELHAYFERKSEEFERPPTRDYRQVFYEDPDTVPANILEQLNGGVNPATLGVDSINFRRNMKNVATREIAGSFQPEVSKRILAIDDRQWHGPFASDFGLHFLQVVAENPAMQPEFEDVRRWIEMSWVTDRQNAIMDEALVEMREGYRIEVASAPAEAGE